MKKILCVAPHPDDETLGCGGTLLKHKRAGDKIYWLIMTGMSPESGYSARDIARREKEIGRVARAYGFSGVFVLGFPAAQLDQVPKKDLVSRVSAVLQDIKPSVIYLPGRYDAHSDHAATFDAVVGAAKTFRAPFVKKVLACEILSETEFAVPARKDMFIPNVFSDITGSLEQKVRIMKIFRSEIKKHPFPRSAENIRALAVHRGAMAGVRHAEAFSLIKEIL